MTDTDRKELAERIESRWNQSGYMSKEGRRVVLALNEVATIAAALRSPAGEGAWQRVERAYRDTIGGNWLFCNRWRGHAGPDDVVCDCDADTGCKDMLAAAPPPPSRGEGTTLYLDRSSVRAILVQSFAVELLRDIDRLPVLTADDISSPKREEG